MFGRRLTLFELFGFTVRIDASWLLLAGLIVWSLAIGYFPNVTSGYAPFTYWVMGFAGLIGLALSLVVHELAHSLVGRRLAIPISGITLFLFGGIAEMTGEPASALAEFLMAIAGPVMSLILAGLAGGAAFAVGVLGAAADNPAVAVVDYLALINLFLAGFNMMPAFPLDGGRVLRAILWGWRGDVLWATRMAAKVASLCAIALMAVGAWQAGTGALVAGMWLVMIGLFVRAAAVQALRRELARHAMESSSPSQGSSAG